MRLRERIRERVTLLEHVRLLADLQLERPGEDVDELHLARERGELFAGPRAWGDDGLDRLEALLVTRREEVVDGREGGVRVHALASANERRGGLGLEDGAEPDAERVADPRDRGERRGGAVPLELADEALRQARRRRKLLDRQPAFASQRADAGPYSWGVVACRQRGRSGHEPIIRRFSPRATPAAGECRYPFCS